MAIKRKTRKEARKDALRIAVTESEKEIFSALADRKHQSLSELVRQELYRVLHFEKIRQIQNA